MPGAQEMPLAEVLQALGRTPTTQPQVRAVLATTCARWHLQRGQVKEALRDLAHAVEMVPDLRPAMRLSYRACGERGDVRTAVNYLDQEIRATRHPREAAALYRERGQLVEAQFRDLGAAQQCYEAALKATPHDLAVLRSVERVCLARGDIFGLMDILEAQLESLKDPEAIAGVLRDLALLEARRGGDLSLGSNLLLQALRYAPGHPGLISDLFRMAECSGDADLLLRALELEAEARPPRERGMPLARASVTFREHRELVAAIALLEAASYAQPRNFSLWRNLEELSMSCRRYDMALRACLGQLRAIGDEEDPAARSELLHRIGRLALFRLDRVPEGLAAMRKAMRLCPGHVTALEDAGQYLAANEMWAQLLELAKLEIATAKKASLTAEELAIVHLRAGQLMEERLREPEGARQLYQDALTVHPTFRPAQDRLERVLHQLGHVEELRGHYRDELKRVTTPARRVFLLSMLGQLHARQHDPSESIKYLVALLKDLPDHLPSLQLLARLLSRAKRPKDLLRVTEQEVKLTLSPVRRAKLLHRAGELAIELDDRKRARKFFSDALEAIDDHPPSIEALDRLLREDGDDEALMELLRKKLLYANDRSRQLGLRLEIANLLATRLERQEQALAELEQLLQRWPRHLPAQHAAERLAASLGREDTLLGLLEQHIAAASGQRTRALLLHRTAIIRSRRGDAEAAVRDLVRALELWPQLGAARALLLRQYELLGRHRELQSFAESGLTSERGADDRRAMALQLAELTPRAVVAIQYLGAVAEARPEDFVTQIRLARASRRARRPSHEAGALSAAADHFAEELPSDDPQLLAFRYRAARAHEAVGNLDAADQGYARVLDEDPGHRLAKRGRLRVKDRQRAGALARRASDLQTAAQEVSTQAQKAACLTIAAEAQERRRDLLGALELTNTALQHSPEYLPALHARARLLERFGEAANLAAAVETLQDIAGRIHAPAHRARVLCRAGTLALRTVEPRTANPRAWDLFRQALAADPDCDPAFRGLQRVRALHGAEGAPKLGDVLRERLDALRSNDRLDVESLREIGRLGGETDGPECTVELFEHDKDGAFEDPGLHADLAQAYARLDCWPDVVRELETALEHEVSPERAAILHFFAGDALEQAGDPSSAIDHYVAAGRGGFHARRALLAADRIAEETGAVNQRAEALQLLVDVEVGPYRARSLRALADLHQGPLGQPDTAVEIMRQLLLLRPTDIDVLSELRRLLLDLERPEEAAATTLAGVAHQRAWLRSRGVRDDTGEGINVDPLVGLCRLFDALAEIDGVYVAAAILEVIAPNQVPRGRDCDSLVSEPWPLPSPQEGRPFDVLIGDLPCTSAIDLLREGVFYLSEVPGVLPPPVDLSPSRSLPPSSAAVTVTRALSDAMGVRQPLVFSDPSAMDTVVAHVGATPCLILGKRISASPFSPLSRDLIGRALLRLTTGGDYMHRDASPAQMAALVAGLARGAGIDAGPIEPCDDDFAAAVASALPSREALGELAEVARAFSDHTDEFDVLALRAALQMAEDRAGTVCSADPRPTVRLLTQAGDLTTQRATTLFGYLVSDDHLGLRRAIGYHAVIDLDLVDIEEIPRVTDQLNISGRIFRTGPPPVAETPLDERDGAARDSTLLLDSTRSDALEGEPPSVTQSAPLFWPSHSGLHSSLLSTAARIDSAEAWQALAEELTEEAKHIEDPDLRSAILCEAGRILVDRLGRQEEGERLIRKSESPLAKVLLADGAGNVATLASNLAELEALAQDASKDAGTRAAAWIEFGQLCEERASNVSRGLEAYEKALALVENHPVALSLAADAAIFLEKSGLARELVMTRLELCNGPRMRAALLLDLAELIDDPLLRRKVLTQAHDVDPKEETVLRRLIRSISATDDLSSLGQRYLDLARISEDPVSANTALHLAFLTLVEAGQPVERLVVELADRASEQGAAEDLLAPLAEVALCVEQRIAARDDSSGLPENVAVLEPLALALDDPGEQALVREQLARTRLEMLRRTRREGEKDSVGREQGKEKHIALCEAIESDLRFCLMHMSSHHWTREALAELLALKPDLVGLVGHLQEWARLESAGPARAAVLLRLGQVHEDLRNDLPRAGEVYELALAEEPDNTNCLRALGRVYENMRRWPQAVAMLQRQAKETEDETERLAILRRVALMAEQDLRDVDLAVATLEEVARLDPDDLLSLYQLAALCRTHGRAPVLINTLQLLADRADDDVARTGILVELGEVLELTLKQRDAARSCYERALKLSPGYTPALRALSRLYRDSGDIEALLGLFSPEVDPITDPAVLALKAARVALEPAQDMDRAVGLAQQAYQTNPDLIPARDLLMELFMASDRIQEAYDLLRAHDLPRTPPLLADYHYRLGLLAERLARENEPDRARHEDAALQHYRAALIAQPEHGLAFERARRLLVAHNDNSNLIRLAEHRAKHVSKEARAVPLVQIARLHACDGESTEPARRAYERASEAAPADALVRREYEGLLRRLQDEQSLPALYLTAARNSRDAHYRATLSVEAAEVLLRTGAAEDREVAANAVLGALRDDPGNPYAVRHLERLLGAPGSSLAVKDAVGARAVRAQSEAERAIFYLESAELLERAGELEQARRAYHAAEDAMPNLAPATLGLARIASGRQVAATATETRTSVHVLMAEARDAAMRSGAGDPTASKQALDLVTEILDRDPHHRDAIALARALVGHLPDATPVLRLLATNFLRIDDASLRYELGLFLGEHAGRLEHTVRYYGAAAAARPDGKEALRGLIHAYRQMGDQARAAEATERLLQLFDPSEPAAIDLRLGLAAFLGENPATLQRALAHARLVVQVRGDDARAVSVMTDLLERSGARPEAAQLIDRLIGLERDRDQQHDLYLRKAKLLATMPGQEAEALTAVEHAASISPGNRETVTLLTELLDRTGQSYRVSTYLQSIRGALLANVSRGAVSLGDLRLLSHVASRTDTRLAEMANLLLFAIEPTSTEPPPGHMEIASAAGLQQVLQTPALRSTLYSSAEPPALHELLRSVDVVLDRLSAEFAILDPKATAPPVPSADPSSFAVLLRQWADLLGLGDVKTGACSTNNAIVVLQGQPVTLRLGANLWARGDIAAWRGCAAVALARTAFETSRARSLPPVEMDLLLAACFETAEVFNPITADPDPQRLRDLTIQLEKLLPRSNRKAVERACNSLASRAFDPAATARATLTTDLRMAAIMTGDVGGCLSAACLIDGVEGGGLGQRLGRSLLAQELLVFLLGDSHLQARITATS